MGAYFKCTHSSAVSSDGKLYFEVSFPSSISAIFNIVLISGLLLKTHLILFLIISPTWFGTFSNGSSTFCIILGDSVNNNPLVSKRVISVDKKPKLALIKLSWFLNLIFQINVECLLY